MLERAKPQKEKDEQIAAVLAHLLQDDDQIRYRPGLEDILAHIDTNWGRWLSVGKGWYPLLIETHQQLVNLKADYKIEQIKEKYGGLRYYWNYGLNTYQQNHPQPQDPQKWNSWFEEQDKWYDSPQGKQALEDELAIEQAMEDIVRRAEEKSMTICDRCGQSGQLRERNHWYATLCSADAGSDWEIVASS